MKVPTVQAFIKPGFEPKMRSGGCDGWKLQ